MAKKRKETSALGDDDTVALRAFMQQLISYVQSKEDNYKRWGGGGCSGVAVCIIRNLLRRLAIVSPTFFISTAGT